MNRRYLALAAITLMLWTAMSVGAAAVLLIGTAWAMATVITETIWA